MDVGRRAKQFAPFAALRGLDETIRQKTVLNLVYFEEMRQQDVAAYLGIKQQSVNDLLNRALKTMKKKAENEEF